MARYLGPKCKLCRREGLKLFLKGERCNSTKCAMVKRNFPPGQHGATGYPRLTGYGVQLREKQRVKRFYQILETQFRNYFDTARQQKGNTESTLLQLLEMRLDAVVCRGGLVSSRATARELVRHGHFTVNGKRVNIPSYQVRIGDVITFKDSSKKLPAFAKVSENMKNIEAQQWMTIDPKNVSVKIVSKPGEKEVKNQPFDFKVIVEFYSR